MCHSAGSSTGATRARVWRVVAVVLVVWIGSVQSASAQLGALLSPGRLAQPHANLEGLANCTKCHEQGRKVTAQKCLACHAPVADRIARKVGVHRDVTTDCVTCHADHAGVDAQLRPFDQKGFNHTTLTGFPLTGKHAPAATECAKCHATRSFMTAKTTCGSCHADVHKGTLGTACTTCHATDVAWKTVTGRFDHAKAAFPLIGAHSAVACASCHVGQAFKGVKFASCTDCHRDPHQKSFGTTCTSCHTSVNWRTRTINHTRTAFPLVGKHETVTCASCHKQSSMKVKPKADTCAACHVDVHRGTFTQDCKSCHSESSWEKAPFDHSTTKLTLTGKHDGLTCVKCHTTVALTARVVANRVADFRGLSTTCVSCHTDVHQAELGVSCQSCHTDATFQVPKYTHAQTTAFFGGQHAALTCEKCHVPAPLTAPRRTSASLASAVKFKSASQTCMSCHEDVHLGQQGTLCETCHSVETAKFVVSPFAHTTRTTFTLKGRHETVACAECHNRETGVFPAKSGTAVRFKGLGTQCRACHSDVHLGQLGDRCETCHQEVTFKLAAYTHRGKGTASFFTGKHKSETCAACHKPATAKFPGGNGTAVRFTVDSKCVSCHTDIHRGALGPNCGTCHRP